jgi:FMN phosphatase YigB (HAD superfamily)
MKTNGSLTLPKTVVFDLGKVLLDFDYSLAAQKIALHSDRDAGFVQDFIDHSPLLFRYETGLIGKELFFEEIRNATGFRGDFEAFSDAFCDIFTPIEPMIALHGCLRTRGIETHIFSNTNDLAVGHIRNKFPFFNTFTSYVFSYKHGAMKPQASLYEVVERQTGRRAEDILYIDDRAENVAAGAARGWQTILQERPEKTCQRCMDVGLLIP